MFFQTEIYFIYDKQTFFFLILTILKALVLPKMFFQDSDV